MCDGCNPSESICCSTPEAISCLDFEVLKFRVHTLDELFIKG